MKKLVISMLLSLTSFQAIAGANIAFGKLKGIKIYEKEKLTKIYFEDDATHKSVEFCEGVATITHAIHDKAEIDRILSIALSAFAAGKKVRAYSTSSTCELDFIAIQETYF